MRQVIQTATKSGDRNKLGVFETKGRTMVDEEKMVERKSMKSESEVGERFGRTSQAMSLYFILWAMGRQWKEMLTDDRAHSMEAGGYQWK